MRCLPYARARRTNFFLRFDSLPTRIFRIVEKSTSQKNVERCCFPFDRTGDKSSFVTFRRFLLKTEAPSR